MNNKLWLYNELYSISVTYVLAIRQDVTSPHENVATVGRHVEIRIRIGLC